MFCKTKWIVACCLMLGSAASLVQAQDCGCAGSSPAMGTIAHSDGCNSCGGAGGNFLSNLHAHVKCDPSMRRGLWDGYCQERVACETTNSHSHGFGFLRGCRLGLGCGSSTACGTTDGCAGGCFTPASCGGSCGHIFGGASCFRRDGHFFSSFRRHDCDDCMTIEAGCDQPAPVACDTGCDSGCNLFGHHRSGPGFLSRVKGIFHRGGSCGCGHFGMRGGCGSMDYNLDGCGCAAAVTPSCGTDN